MPEIAKINLPSRHKDADGNPVGETFTAVEE